MAHARAVAGGGLCPIAARFVTPSTVLPGLVPGIHVFGSSGKDVVGRDKPGHDE
jgi:hypothetical protein